MGTKTPWSSSSMKQVEFFYSLLDEMLVHRRVTPSIKFASSHEYTWVERGTVKVGYLTQEHNTVPQPGLKPGLLTPELSVLTMRTPCLLSILNPSNFLPKCSIFQNLPNRASQNLMSICNYSLILVLLLGLSWSVLFLLGNCSVTWFDFSSFIQFNIRQRKMDLKIKFQIRNM